MVEGNRVETLASILVVDDDVTVRDVIQRMLEIAGYEVVSARDGIEALAILDSRHVDMILADIAMPRMNGYELYERVVKNPQWVVLPFVFLTARAMDSDIRYGKALGVDDYLVKPFAREDLLGVIRGRLWRARMVAEALTAQSSAGEAEILTLGRLRIDLGQHRVWLQDRPVKLSAREFRLLACLASEGGRVVSLQDLVRETHELRVDRSEAGSLLRPLVRSLRRKLGYPAGQMGCIENVRGVGYQLLELPS